MGLSVCLFALLALQFSVLHTCLVWNFDFVCVLLPNGSSVPNVVRELLGKEISITKRKLGTHHTEGKPSSHFPKEKKLLQQNLKVLLGLWRNLGVNQRNLYSSISSMGC